MLQDHAKIVQFMSLAGEVTGRKKLQKMIYIAKKMNFPFQEKYNFHIYGPYSEELTVRVEELCNLGFIEELKEDKGSYMQYRYIPTTTGIKFSSIIGEADDKLLQTVKEMNSKSSRFLELVSTLLYFDDLEKKEQIAKLHVVKAKLNFSEDEIKTSYSFIEGLKN